MWRRIDKGALGSVDLLSDRIGFRHRHLLLLEIAFVLLLHGIDFLRWRELGPDIDFLVPRFRLETALDVRNFPRVGKSSDATVSAGVSFAVFAEARPGRQTRATTANTILRISLMLRRRGAKQTVMLSPRWEQHKAISELIRGRVKHQTPRRPTRKHEQACLLTSRLHDPGEHFRQLVGGHDPRVMACGDFHSAPALLRLHPVPARPQSSAGLICAVDVGAPQIVADGTFDIQFAFISADRMWCEAALHPFRIGSVRHAESRRWRRRKA